LGQSVVVNLKGNSKDGRSTSLEEDPQSEGTPETKGAGRGYLVVLAYTRADRATGVREERGLCLCGG